MTSKVELQMSNDFGTINFEIFYNVLRHVFRGLYSSTNSPGKLNINYDFDLFVGGGGVVQYPSDIHLSNFLAKILLPPITTKVLQSHVTFEKKCNFLQIGAHKLLKYFKQK